MTQKSWGLPTRRESRKGVSQSSVQRQVSHLGSYHDSNFQTFIGDQVRPLRRLSFFFDCLTLDSVGDASTAQIARVKKLVTTVLSKSEGYYKQW